VRKFLASLFSVLIGSTALAQQKGSVVKLISSSQTTGVKQGNVDFLKVYNGIFQQNNSTLRSDSAYFYPQSNSFDAFGNVNINQGDSLNIYADKLNYSGNTNIAILTNNVRMVDRDAVLSTNYLTYNTATKIGTYTGGGTLVNKTTNLVSKNGYYFANSRDAYFRYDVVLKTPEAVIKSDTLRYNSGSKIAFFYGPTNIYGKDDTLYTENGTYNTKPSRLSSVKRTFINRAVRPCRVIVYFMTGNWDMAGL
jgi:lipopolysaccharide assembly outer membrane protein LptD (OstA)